MFTDDELVELGFFVGGCIMWGRLHRAFAVPPSGGAYHALLATLAGSEVNGTPSAPSNAPVTAPRPS